MMITKEELFDEIEIDEGDAVFVVVQHKKRQTMQRFAFGHDAISLIGLLAYLQDDVIRQIRGEIKADIKTVSRTVLVEKTEEES